MLKTLFKEQLHAQANAEERLFSRQLLYGAHKPGFNQLCHCVAEGAHAGEDYPFSPEQLVRLVRNQAVQPQEAEAGRQRKQIAHAVIHNSNHKASPIFVSDN